MIEFVEIRDESRTVIGLVDTAKSIIWNVDYYGIGDFEIYAPFTVALWELLQAGRYVTRENERNIGMIEHINIAYDAIDGRMILASGRFCKAILARRLIYNLSGKSITPVISRGNVEVAARNLVNISCISAKDSARNIDFLQLGQLAGLPAVIDGQKQTSYSNLQEYTDELLHEFEYGAYIGIDRETQNLFYSVFAGADRSANNTSGNDPIVFSQDFDNLLASSYDYDESAYKNTALIGGAGEGTARFMQLATNGARGLDRREVFIDASDQSRTYKDENETEIQYTDSEYSNMLLTKAAQEMAAHVIVERFDGAVDITNSGLQFGIDFYCGDVVTVQDNTLQKYATARIVRVTEIHDESGYNIAVEFGE